MLRPNSGSFLQTFGIVFKFIFCLSRRYWQAEAETAEAKLQTLTSQVNGLRERFRQTQREVETQEVWFNEFHSASFASDVFSVGTEILIGG
jgi:hypothetical protein